jgi:hypothetical protein
MSVVQSHTLTGSMDAVHKEDDRPRVGLGQAFGPESHCPTGPNGAPDQPIIGPVMGPTRRGPVSRL